MQVCLQYFTDEVHSSTQPPLTHSCSQKADEQTIFAHPSPHLCVHFAEFSPQVIDVQFLLQDWCSTFNALLSKIQEVFGPSVVQD